MEDTLTPRAKRLLVMLAVTPWLFLIVFLGSPYLGSQRRHLMAVESHLDKIRPTWLVYQDEHREFEALRLFAYTGGDGMIGVQGYVASTQQLQHLRAFLEASNPPRPVFLGAVRVLGEGGIQPKSKGE